MKKLLVLIIAGFLCSTGLHAQPQTVKKEQKTLKTSIVDKKEDKHEVGNDLSHLRIKDAAQKRREVRRHKKSIHRQGEQLEKRGMKHPVHHAKVQAKKEKDLKNGRD